MSALASSGTPRLLRTHIPVLPQPLGGCGPGGRRPRKRRAVARPPLPPGKRSVRTGGLVRGSDGRDGHTPGSVQSQNPPRFLCARCGNKKGQNAGLRGRPGLGEQGGREASGPSSRFPKLQPQSSRGRGGGTPPARAPAEPSVTDGRWECGRSLSREL